MEKIDENSKNNMHTCNSIFTQPLKLGAILFRFIIIKTLKICET